jgi:hypothetical protein
MNNVIQFPGMLTRISRFVIVGSWTSAWGWDFKLRHRHEHEPLNCLYVASYADLTTLEMIDVLGEELAGFPGPYSWDSKQGRCYPDYS